MNQQQQKAISEITAALRGVTVDGRVETLEAFITADCDAKPDWAEDFGEDAIATVAGGTAVLAWGAERDCGTLLSGEKVRLRDVVVYTDADTATVVSSAEDVDAATEAAREGMADALQAEQERGLDDAGYVSGLSEYSRNDAGEYVYFM